MNLKFVHAALLAFTLSPGGLSQAAVVTGVQLSEQELGEWVYVRIAEAWDEPTLSLTVAVERDLVELSGEAPSAAAAEKAEQVAQETPGVVTVLNRLRVR
jgi:hypothetical protein